MIVGVAPRDMRTSVLMRHAAALLEPFKWGHDTAAELCARAALLEGVARSADTPAPRGGDEVETVAGASCRACGCTDARPCFFDAETGETIRDAGGVRGVICAWVEPDLCSACVADQAPPLLFDANHNPLRRGSP